MVSLMNWVNVFIKLLYGDDRSERKMTAVPDSCRLHRWESILNKTLSKDRICDADLNL